MKGLGNNERKYFLGIANGKVTYRPAKDAEVQTFDFVEGRITGISRRDATINGKPMKFYEFSIENGGEKYVLSLLMDSSVARGIILPLASVQNFAGLSFRISPWLKDAYTNVSVYANGQKLNWGIDPKDLPPIKTVQVGLKEYTDDTERIQLIESLVDQINERITATANDVDYDQYPADGNVGDQYYDDGLHNGTGPAGPGEPAPGGPGPDYGPGTRM